MKKEKFEDHLHRVEKIVEELENGEISLDKSIQKFEEGMKLVKLCSEKLNEVQKKVEIPEIKLLTVIPALNG